jgi:hypothetical protein
MTETGDGGVCYTGGEVVKQNYQMCDVTNKAIRDLLGAQVPQVTFTCHKESGECDFQCESRFDSYARPLAYSSQSGLMNKSLSCAT